MLKIRIIPTLLWKNHGLVKGKSFDSWRQVGTVLPAIKVYNTRQVDELILVDITATKEKRDLNYDEIGKYTSESFVPLTIGGGINNIAQIRKIYWNIMAILPLSKMKNALVCGAEGFIGGHLVKLLKDEGYWVRGMDIKMHEYIESVADEFVKGDLRLIGLILRVIFYLYINKHTFIII